MGFRDFFTNKSKDTVKAPIETDFETNLPYSFAANTFIASGVPVYTKVSTDRYLLKVFRTNPIVQAIIDIKATAYSNKKYFVEDLETGEKVLLRDYDKDRGALKRLINSPNPLQGSGKKYLKQNKINYYVFGNSFQYASFPSGFEKFFDYKDILALNTLHPDKIAVVLTGKWLTATSTSEIISEYQFTAINGDINKINSEFILKNSETNLDLNSSFVLGESKLVALQRPISNIQGAYESRNILIHRRGPTGMLSAKKTDPAVGNIPMTKEEVKQTQKDFRKYGMKDDQHSFFLSRQPMEYQKTGFNVDELKLFEEIEANAITVATAYGVPELLVKQYVTGATFENASAAEKRLYDSTIIPESEADDEALNKFLRLEEHGIRLVGSFDHVEVLQKNKKETSETKKISIEAAEKAFRMGAVNYNYVLSCMDLENNDEIGELHIWDLSPEQLMAINKQTSASRQNTNDNENN